MGGLPWPLGIKRTFNVYFCFRENDMSVDAPLHAASGLSDEAIFECLAEAILRQGYAVLPDVLPERVSSALLHHLALYEEYEFFRAEIGRGAERAHNADVRRDKIAWIEAESPYSNHWLEWTQALRIYLNRRLFMGLFSFESHFAFYRPGDFYLTHMDAFRGQSNRMLSVVAYLNDDWGAELGGELVIYHPETHVEVARVAPTLGTLVAFLSEEFPHEVKPALRTRYSVAGWFRVNTSTSSRVDPPQ